MNISYIALGSNLESPMQQVTAAINEIAKLGNITNQSSWYKSTAVGPGTQDDYINGVLCLETPLIAEELLDKLQAIENLQGRVRDIRWGARTLDLDILLFNNDVTNTEKLIVPHPRMSERNFVIFPLCEIAPEAQLTNNQSVLDIQNTLSQQGLEKLC